jgi:hypothetical protein
MLARSVWLREGDVSRHVRWYDVHARSLARTCDRPMLRQDATSCASYASVNVFTCTSTSELPNHPAAINVITDFGSTTTSNSIEHCTFSITFSDLQPCSRLLDRYISRVAQAEHHDACANHHGRCCLTHPAPTTETYHSYAKMLHYHSLLLN